MERSCDCIWILTQLYRRLYGRQTRIFRFSSTMRGGKLAIAALPPLVWAANSHFPVFLHCERRKAGNCSFTAATIGGNVDFPGFLRSERRKTGSCGFTAALIGGKLDFPVFLRCERRKTGNCRYAPGTFGGNLSIRFFIRFSLLMLLGGSWVEA